MKKRLVTSALPYVNNIPHLGNLIQVLSADVFARYCRLAGYETLYICGTDEYGTATETKALEEGVSPQELCDRFFAIHRDIYKWFNISFDHFGRTSRPKQTEITQSIFKDVDAAGFIQEKTIEQLYCEDKDMFLADRYVRGTCPHCEYPEARGDQCENCGKLLEPTELINPYSPVCEGELKVKETKHLYLDLPALKDRLEAWIKAQSVDGFWAKNALKMTEAWIRDGLKERAITRDLKWGIPVPKEGFENKVFYVWFDAPIGYISITADLTDDWKDWWQNNDNVELFQFIGKDNIPFHTVIFPSSLLASGKPWTMLHHMSSSEYLNYEEGKFSKSAGVGVFGNDAQDTGIPADVWRFYLYYNRPEKSDTMFNWNDFTDKVNSELIGNFSNLVNRTFTFVGRFFEGQVPAPAQDPELWETVKPLVDKAKTHFERAELKDALKTMLEISAVGNKIFQEAEPWKLVKTDPEATGALLADLVYLIKDLSVIASPFIPSACADIQKFIGHSDLSWENIGEMTGIETVTDPQILFQKLNPKEIQKLREKYAGSQKERAQQNSKQQAPEAELSLEERFNQQIDLRVATITAVEQHPEAEKLYIETIDTGAEEPTQIVSGLVPYYKPEELLGKNIILVANLKPAKLRGVKSYGMLLAADGGDGSLEVLFAPDAKPGDQVLLEGAAPAEEPKKKLSIDKFFKIPIRVEDHQVKVGDGVLTLDGKALTTLKVAKGEVG
jgi:methionyl-tRNA synthetase